MKKHKTGENMLFKYRSLKNFDFFVDIILNGRLHAAQYLALNDLMEGHYIYNSGYAAKEMKEAIKGRKMEIRICSLSKTNVNALMWAHYADANMGVVIGVNINNLIYDVRPITYSKSLPKIRYLDIDNMETAKQILTHKYAVWAYEQEERVFITGKETFVNVEIKKIILGNKMSSIHKNLIKSLVDKISPDIEISQIDRANLTYE